MEPHAVENTFWSPQVVVLFQARRTDLQAEWKQSLNFPWREPSSVTRLQVHTTHAPLGKGRGCGQAMTETYKLSLLCPHGNVFLFWSCSLVGLSMTHKRLYLLLRSHQGGAVPKSLSLARYCHQFAGVWIPHAWLPLNKRGGTTPDSSPFRQREQVYSVCLKSCHTRFPFICTSQLTSESESLSVSPKLLIGTSVLFRKRPEYFSVVNLVIETLCRYDSIVGVVN